MAIAWRFGWFDFTARNPAEFRTATLHVRPESPDLRQFVLLRV
jgi:hypothetical protein